MDSESIAKEAVRLLNGLNFHTYNNYMINCMQYYDRAMASPRSTEPRRLLRHGYKAYSQNGEDGLIQEIFARIGTTTRAFVEFGVEGGLECNTLYLLLCGWRGLWMDGSPQNVGLVRQRFGGLEEERRLRVAAELVTAENINELIKTHIDEENLDLISIDIDYNDYWVWKALDVVRPRVVVIEYNATIRPPAAVAAAYDPRRAWDGSNYYGASLSALEKLGRDKGYCLVGCDFCGINSFFVREDVVGRHFCEPFTAENHYEPPRYFFRLPSGHRPGFGDFVHIE